MNAMTLEQVTALAADVGARVEPAYYGAGHILTLRCVACKAIFALNTSDYEFAVPDVRRQMILLGAELTDGGWLCEQCQKAHAHA